MRSRRVPFKVAVQGSRRRREVVAFIVRNRSQRSWSFGLASDLPERRKLSRNVELSSLFTFRISKVSVTGIGGVVVAKCRTVVTFRLASHLRVSKVTTVTGIGGGPGRETQNCRHFWTRLASSRLASVNSHRDPGVVVAKRRTVVTFGLVSRLRISQVSTVTGIGGSWSRNAELSSLLDSSCVFASQKCQSQGSGGSFLQRSVFEST